DAAVTTAARATFFSLDHCRRRRRAVRLVVVGVTLGLALLTKFTAVLMLPVLFVLLVGVAIPAGTGAAVRLRGAGTALRRASLRFAVLCVVALLVVNVGYGMH